MILRTLIAGAFALAFGIGAAQADPIDVSYTVSGSAGDWTYEFAVKSNLPTAFNTYLFGAAFSSDQITGSPSGWLDFGTVGTLPLNHPGLSQPYNNVWLVTTPYLSSIAPGATLGGFVAHDTSATAFTSLDWFAFAKALDNAGDVDQSAVYSGPGCSINCDFYQFNPGFQGTASVVTSTPLPATLPLFASGLGSVGLLAWRRRRKNA